LFFDPLCTSLINCVFNKLSASANSFRTMFLFDCPALPCTSNLLDHVVFALYSLPHQVISMFPWRLLCFLAAGSGFGATRACIFLAMISLLFRFPIFYFYSVIDGNGKAHGLNREPLLPEKLLSLGGTAAVFPAPCLQPFSHWCEPPTKILYL